MYFLSCEEIKTIIIIIIIIMGGYSWHWCQWFKIGHWANIPYVWHIECGGTYLLFTDREKFQTNLVCETQITWSMSANENCKNLLVMMERASAKPKREWSVNSVRSPMVRAWRRASWQRVEKALKGIKEYF